MTRQEIFELIDKERVYQDTQWGTGFDDKNTLNDWAIYMVQQVSKATMHENADVAERRARILKAVTIGVALLERDFENEVATRHYDGISPNRPNVDAPVL